MKKVKFCDVLEYEQPTKYIVKNEQYKDEYKIPVLTAGKSFILGYTDETEGICCATKDNPIILFDDFTTDCRYIDFKFKVKSSAVKILKLKSNDNNLKYLYYILKSIVYDTSSHKRYWISQYSKFEIELPNIDIQNKIVNEIEKIEDLITLKEKQIFKFNELAKSKFIEIFGNQYENEKGLKVGKVEDVAEIYLGLTYTPNYIEDGVKFISAKNISSDFLDLSDVKYISRDEFNKASNGAKPQVNDILFSRVGSNLGHPVILKDKIELCTFVSLGFLRPKKNITSTYLKYWMKDDYFYQQIKQNVGGGGQPNLNTGWLKNFRILIPNMESQILFEKIIDQIDEQKEICDRIKSKLNDLKNVKMEDYFGGVVNE